MVAGGKDGTDLNAGQSGKRRNGNGRKACCPSKNTNLVPGAVGRSGGVPQPRWKTHYAERGRCFAGELETRWEKSFD